MANYYLVLLETSGNQNFIFSTNKLKENIGASELTYQAGTFWVSWAVDQVNQQTSFKKCSSSEEFRKALNSQSKLEETPTQNAEILVGASGKALVLTRSEEIAKKIIGQVTHRALKKAPGLDIAGVFVPVEDWGKDGSLHQAIAEVHKEFEKMRSGRPSPINRFLRLPIIADCAVSELPAGTFEKLTKAQEHDGKTPSRISLVSSVKREIAPKAIERLQAIAKPYQLFRTINDLEKFEEELSWLAIVHADGNGLGQIFLNLDKYIDTDNRIYADKFRDFSLALDECTEAAFRSALSVFADDKPDEKDKKAIPIVPLIVGGDDLTVVCHGEYALEFTRVFLQEFEKQTADHKDIKAIAKKAFGVGKLSACAGISIIKPHFPFSVAYHLAERLIKSAKTVKETVTCVPTDQIEENTPFPCSAIDFHILYDSSGADFDEIRDRLTPEKNVYLHNRPYVVSEALEEAEDTGQQWAASHDWSALATKIEELNRSETDPKYKDRPKLARSQCGELRSALHINKKVADAKYQLIRQRYHTQIFEEDQTQKSLFHQDSDHHYSTSFLDALDARDFLTNAENVDNRTTGDDQ
ncbi:Cas10/Cmr2 second palm domain-containing protein [[Limnothrix rosea] IAM M-220]|uniref:Cas10/Cmr2 second palm domain-containing protein n=1 Tax=[Limnothrix rosea] IAM M-220 TaxID=454133 RepID=UPI0015C53E74|nr:hypothetical protein [[Limnothrix rosea] IAM M-220]